MEPIPPAYVAWRAGTITLILPIASIDFLKIPAQGPADWPARFDRPDESGIIGRPNKPRYTYIISFLISLCNF